MCRNQKEGSITAYLTLILFLILAIITTSVEAARVSTAKVYANRVLNTAMRSTLGEYYLPLYEKYHLFGLDIGYGDVNKNEAELINRIKQTMEDSLHPEINPLYLHFNANKNFLICNLTVDSVTLNERRSIIDKNGDILKKQAIQYQKYDSAADLLTQFLQKFNLLASTEESNELLNEKLEVETKLYEIDKKMLELIEYIDGFEVDENGIKLSKKGKPLTVTNYAKKIINFSVSQDSVQINNSALYAEIQGKYVSPSNIIRDLISKGEEAVDKKEQWEDYEDELDELLEEDDYLNPVYLAKVMSLRSSIRSARNAYQDCITDINSKQSNLETLVIGTLGSIESALSCIESINDSRRESSSYVDSLIDSVAAAKDKLEQSFYEELLRSSDEMKAYTDETVSKISIIYNITQMKETLQSNKEVLNNINKKGIPQFFVGSLNSWKNELQTIDSMFKQYSHSGLAIDYSSFKLEKESNKVLSTFKSLINSGIAGLVIEDMDQLSKAKLPEGSLISTSMSIGKENSNVAMDEMLSNATKEKNNNEMIGTFDQAGISIGSVLAEGGNKILENILYIAYLEDHCSDYLLKDTTGEQVLNYELEYILFGNTTDNENAEATATRIVLIRTIVNLLHVFTDSQKNSTALSFATALVGFSGLPFLVSVTKYIVLFVWAFEAALVETATIMLGKDVPILTTRENFTLEFTEVLSMSKEKIISKAKDYESVKNGLYFGYKDYIRLFLLVQNKTKQNYRTMDLIQENLRYIYDSDFLLSRCITNYEVNVRFEMPQVFLSMPFITDQDMKSVRGYEYDINAAVSY